MSESNNPQSRVEELIENILGAGYQVEPQSRVEKILHAIATNGTYTDPPQSRVEKLLIDVLHSGGGGGDITVEALSVDANGTYTAPENTAYSPVTVNVSGGGGVEVPEKDVNFIDYDGTVLYSYTAQEALALTALPANPSHEGLTAQGWNYTLAEVKTEVNAVGGATVGQMYITDDGKTRLYCHFNSSHLSPVLALGINGTATIDWGDGSSTDTISGTSISTKQYASHTYSAEGYYRIDIAVDGTAAIIGYDICSYLLKNTESSSQTYADIGYLSSIEKIEIGNNIRLKEYAFYKCYRLKSITLPSVNVLYDSGTYKFGEATSLRSVTLPSQGFAGNSSDNLFNGCAALSSISLPPTATRIYLGMLANACSLASLNIPTSITQIENTALQNCYSLKDVTISENVTSIGSYFLRNNYSVKEVHMRPTTPPTLGYPPFGSIESLITIYVPYSADHSILEAYKTATNWSARANQMQEEPA